MLIYFTGFLCSHLGIASVRISSIIFSWNGCLGLMAQHLSCYYHGCTRSGEKAAAAVSLSVGHQATVQGHGMTCPCTAMMAHHFLPSPSLSERRQANQRPAKSFSLKNLFSKRQTLSSYINLPVKSSYCALEKTIVSISNLVHQGLDNGGKILSS